MAKLTLEIQFLFLNIIIFACDSFVTDLGTVFVS